MSGFENDVMLAKNLNFDEAGAKPHLGIIDAAGKFPIGTGNSQPTPEILGGKITSPNGTLSVGYSSPNITLDTTGVNDLHVARFIVASSTGGTGANFTTIASAIAAAQGTGIKSTVFIQPGTYTENITLVSGINLCAFDCDAQTPNVTIVGKLSFSSAGTVAISGINLQTNSDFALAVTGSAACNVILVECNINALNNTAISYTTSSSSSSVKLFGCTGNLGTTGIGLFSASGTGRLAIFNGRFTNTGASSTASTMSAGTLDLHFNEFDFPITTSGSNAGGSTHNNYNPSAVNTTITWGGTMTSDFDYYSTGTAVGITVSGASFISNAVVNSANTNAISGASTINFANITFEGSSSLINTTTQVPLVKSNDAIKVVTPGAYPYTTTPQDAIIKVDTSSARTITPLASPTTGQMHIIKDTVGSAGANNITVTPSGKNIDGVASKVINTNYGSMTIVYTGSEWSLI